jgi:CheY-specific phosphatase CheX
MKFDIKPFVQSMDNTFSAMLGEKLDIGEVESSNNQKVYTDVSALIDLLCEESASLVLTVASKSALEVSSVMSGKEIISIINPFVSDTIGELLSMIVGTAQKNVDVKYNFSIPEVTKGANHEAVPLSGGYYQRVISKLYEDEIGLYLIGQTI